MTATEATAGLVEHIYREQLLRLAARTPETSGTRRRVRAMLRRGRTDGGGILRPGPRGRTWLTADLRLGSESALDERERPFRKRRRDERHAVREVERHGRPERHRGRRRQCRRAGGIRSDLREEWLALPGRKVLVIGPDEIGPTGGIDAATWETAHLCLIVPTRPELAISHLRIETVPAGSINLHGDAPVSTRGESSRRRICIAAADQLGFELAGIEQLETDAAALALVHEGRYGHIMGLRERSRAGRPAIGGVVGKPQRRRNNRGSRTNSGGTNTH